MISKIIYLFEIKTSCVIQALQSLHIGILGRWESKIIFGYIGVISLFSSIRGRYLLFTQITIFLLFNLLQNITLFLEIFRGGPAPSNNTRRGYTAEILNGRGNLWVVGIKANEKPIFTPYYSYSTEGIIFPIALPCIRSLCTLIVPLFLV